MKCLVIRTEVFGETEVQSYSPYYYDDPKKALSVLKAEIISVIKDEENGEHFDYDGLGPHLPDRFYIYDLKDKNISKQEVEEDFYKKVFKDELRIPIYHGIPEGWEEINPENYNIQEAAFRIRGEETEE